jgi:glycerol-3-phosphate dehydrogenase
VDRVVERLRAAVPERRFGECRTGGVALPGARVEDPDRGGFPGFAKRVRASAPAVADDGLVRHLLHRYGTAAMQLLGRFAADPAAIARVVPELPYRRIEVARAAESEMAATLDDVLRRRVPIAFRHADGGAAAADDVGGLMARILGWSSEETARRVERYRTGVSEERRRRNEPKAAAPTAIDARRRA